MARPYNRSFRSSAIVASPAAAAETVVCQIGNVSTDGVAQAVMLFGWIAFTVGTAGASVRLRIREVGVTGTLVVDSGAVTRGIVAAALDNEDINGIDTPGEQDGLVYVLTLQVGSATAASTVSATNLIAIVSD